MYDVGGGAALRAGSMNVERYVSATLSAIGQDRRVPDKWEKKSSIHVEALEGKGVPPGILCAL